MILKLFFVFIKNQFYQSSPHRLEIAHPILFTATNNGIPAETWPEPIPPRKKIKNTAISICSVSDMISHFVFHFYFQKMLIGKTIFCKKKLGNWLLAIDS